MSFREILVDGDLILQKKLGWWAFGKWHNWRNLSEELRLLYQHEIAAQQHYQDTKRLRIVADGNIKERKESMQIGLMDNSEVCFRTPVETSILEQRDGITYKFDRGGNQKQNNSGKNNQQGNSGQKGGGDNTSGQGNKQGTKGGGGQRVVNYHFH